MYIDNGTLTISPTDLTKFLACTHHTALDLGVVDGNRLAPPVDADEALELLFRMGLDHEARYLATLRRDIDVVVVDPKPLLQAALDTEQAMRDGAAAIFQATFLYRGRRGHADFLLRTARPSDLGGWSYDVADTKLARRLKVPALLQMAEYGEHLRRIQGVPPIWLTVIAGDGVQHPYRYSDVENYHRYLSSQFEHFVAGPRITIAQPCAHCPQCRWQSQCAKEWRRNDHLSLVAFMRTDHRQALEQSGVSKVAALAQRGVDDLPRSIGKSSRDRLAQQARLQIQERQTGKPTYELLPPAPGLGLQRLPEPNPGDLYLDFEGDPYVEPAGREYLAGIGNRVSAFEALWAHSAADERQLTMDLIDRLVVQLKAHPGMHVYHYAPYERSALQRLTSRHGAREAELDVLLRSGILVDLYAVVRQGIRISKESYSIKKLEAFYWGRTRGEGSVADAMASVVAYERWVVEHDDVILEQIRAYNEDDVQSTLALHNWLEERRYELEKSCGSSLIRPQPGKPPDLAAASTAELAETELAQDLLDAGEELLAGLVGWHRREQRPGWWDFFRVENLDDDELVDDGSAIGALGPPVYVADIKKSHVHRYEFPPQDTKLRLGGKAIDVDTHKPAGEVVGISAEEGWIDLKIGKARDAPTPRGCEPEGPLNDKVLRLAIAGVARRVLSGADCLGARLVHGVVPDGLPVRVGERAADAVLRIGVRLNESVLAVQGPPGTGKSTAGAALIRALLDAGLRVGITALSHQVIGNLLGKVGRPAMQRCDQDKRCPEPFVEWAKDNAAVTVALGSGTHRLVGGTSWLWARDDMVGTIDVLIVDEAGQFSLANAVAVSRAAKSMVLLGDPQQLSQPSQAQHPHGAGVSALEHLLAGHATVPPEKGVFLDNTWRMHPAITKFVSVTSYDDRLEAASGLDRQMLAGTTRWLGSGLRWMPVPHVGNESASTEEALAVAEVTAELLAGTWVDRDGVERRLTAEDILVVTPYNAHVGRLKQYVPADVLVGTVDKFQGRQAPVVVYSLASSSAEDAPRGVDFLYDVHRLNVAVSRAQAMTIVVGSPRLLDAPVHNPEQLRLVNALCRYVEMADTVAVRRRPGPPC